MPFVCQIWCEKKHNTHETQKNGSENFHFPGIFKHNFSQILDQKVSENGTESRISSSVNSPLQQVQFWKGATLGHYTLDCTVSTYLTLDVVFRGVDLIKDGNAVGSGLAGPVFRSGQNVPPGLRDRNGGFLDWRRFLPALLEDPHQEFSFQAEVFELIAFGVGHVGRFSPQVLGGKFQLSLPISWRGRDCSLAHAEIKVRYSSNGLLVFKCCQSMKFKRQKD